MAAVVEKQGKRWTYEEYYQLNDNQRYEIIEGSLLMLTLRGGSYELHCSAAEKGRITSLVLSGFTFDLGDIQP